MSARDETIARLIALALGSDRDEEARTCALMALKIASKNGATIRVNGKSAEVTGDAPATPPADAPAPVNAAPPAPSPAASTGGSPPGARTPPASGRKWRGRSAPSRASWSRPFPARRPDTCCACAAPITVGAMISWCSGIGARCN